MNFFSRICVEFFLFFYGDFVNGKVFLSGNSGVWFLVGRFFVVRKVGWW